MSVIQTSNQDITPPTSGTTISQATADGTPVPIALEGFKGGHVSIANLATDEVLHVLFAEDASLADISDWGLQPGTTERYRLELGSPLVIVSFFAGGTGARYIMRTS